VTVALLSLLLLAARPSQDASADSAAAFLALFERAPLVAFCEQHRRSEAHEFLRVLVSHPDFGRVVDDVVVEFGNGLYQPVMDRYVAGEDVPLSELQHVWRDTTQWLVWDSPVYEGFFACVRAANLRRPADERVRVVLGDPAIPWAETKDAAAYRRHAERDRYYADVVEREVLAKDHRALLVYGGLHFLRGGPLPKSSPSAGAILDRDHPQALHIVWTLPGSQELATSLELSRSPELVVLADSPLGEHSFAPLSPKGIQVQVLGQWKPLEEAAWPPMAEVVDSLLYLGPAETEVLPDPAIYRDAAYQAELRRRAAILQEVYGMDFLPELEALVRDEPK